MPLPQAKITLTNTNSETGFVHFTKINAVLEGRIRRSVGAGGDQAVLTVLASDWPAGYDEHGEFEININPTEGPGNRLNLKGYRLKMKIPFNVSREIGEPDEEPSASLYRILLETELRSMRDGFGGLIREGTLNELDEDGFVDIAHADYKTTQELVDICLDSMGLDHEAAPVELNTGIDGSDIDAPGPLDWGNARPLNELDAIVSRLGWTIVQLNNGKVAVRQLRRAGESIDIPADIQAVAEPYEFGSMPSVHSSKIIVTSGATRSTIITSRTLSPGGTNGLEWVVFDPKTNEWNTQPATALVDYQNGLLPGEVDPESAKLLGQLFKAVRLTGDDLIKSSTFVNIPSAITEGDFAEFAGAPGVVEARCCVKVGSDILENTPVGDAGDPIRLDGLRAISGAGVFVLPSDVEYIRMNGFGSGRRSDARELAGNDLKITYAHESNTGDYTTDYFVVGFEFGVNKGAVSINTMLPADVLVALDDVNVVKIGAPLLRRVMVWNEGDDEEVSVNSEKLIDIAKQIATARMSSSLVQSGAIELRGIVDINPGDIDGSVTSVSWDTVAHTTTITINQHEVPRSHYEKLQRASGDSLTSGIGALRLRRSSAAQGTARNTLVADNDLAINGVSTPEGNPAIRGRIRSTSGIAAAEDSGVRVRREIAPIYEQTTIFVQITGANAFGANRWIYDWEEVRFENGLPVKTGSIRKSSTHGQALNIMEMLNSAGGVQANGININMALGTFAIQPVSDFAVVRLSGPFIDGAQSRWYFESINAFDGECAS